MMAHQIALISDQDFAAFNMMTEASGRTLARLCIVSTIPDIIEEKRAAGGPDICMYAALAAIA